MDSKQSKKEQIRKKAGVLILILGCAFLLYGVQRKEDRVVELKSNNICLECIGIG